MPIGWETHSAPDLSGRPQQLINDRVLAHADVLVGIFWTRLGSPTGKAASGTVEEIEEHLKQNKPVILYFSNTPAMLESVDREQYDKLVEFKKWARDKGLIDTYDTKDHFRDQFRRHLTQTMSRMIQQQTSNSMQTFIGGLPLALTPEAEELLAAAVGHESGMIGHRKFIGGEIIGVGNEQFNENDQRSIALWSGACDEIVKMGYINQVSDGIFKVSREGYSYVDNKKN